MPVTWGDVAEYATSNRKRGSGVREEGVQEAASTCRHNVDVWQGTGVTCIH